MQARAVVIEISGHQQADAFLRDETLNAAVLVQFTYTAVCLGFLLLFLQWFRMKLNSYARGKRNLN
jgi:hypothetical protein